MPLFPIHDAARADDIRMRRRRALLLLAGIGVTGWSLLDSGNGDRHRRYPGLPAVDAPSPRFDGSEPARSFRIAASGVVGIDLPCAGSVTLTPRSDLGERVLVSAGRDQGTALATVTLVDGRIAQSEACDGGPADFTLQLDADRAVRIRQSGSTDIRGGSFGGAVAIDSDGSGAVTLGRVGSLADTQSGSGDVMVGTVSGAVTARLSGSGDLRVAGGTVLQLSAASTGSGDIDLGRAAISGGRVELSGSGGFTAATVNGDSLVASTSNSGDIAIGSVHLGDVRLDGRGSGDIAIRGGTIGNLVADRGGSGDLVVDAAVASGGVSHHGSGDVRLPQAASAVTGVPDGRDTD